MSTTFDPNNKTNVTLSGGNLTATPSGGGGVASTAGLSNRYIYFEIKPTTISGTVGIGLFAFNGFGPPNNTTPGNGTDEAMLQSGGAFKINGSTIATIFTYANTDTIGVAVDTALRLIWFTKNGTTWNNDIIGNQNPVGAVGGLSLATLNGQRMFAGVAASASGPVFVGQFSSFSYTAPSGYVSLDTATSVSAASEVTLYPLCLTTITMHQAAKLADGISCDRPNSTTVSGHTKEGTTPVSKVVMVFQKTTGTLIGTTVSDASTGAWSVNCGGIYDVFCVAFDPTTYQALVYDEVIPG